MSTESIATRLVDLCRKADFKTAQDELYASDAVSIEPEGSPWSTAEGIEALNAKVAQWNEMVAEVHSVGVSDPMVVGNFFSVEMTFDLTMQNGMRNRGEQIAVYEVRDDKVVREQFFYSM